MSRFKSAQTEKCTTLHVSLPNSLVRRMEKCARKKNCEKRYTRVDLLADGAILMVEVCEGKKYIDVEAIKDIKESMKKIWSE